MKLTEIKALVRIIEDFDSSDHKPLDLKKLKKASSNLGNFYRHLTNNQELTDVEAVYAIYKKKSKNPNFKSLKSYFMSRLINNVASLDLAKKDISEQTIASYNGYKSLFVSNVLSRIGSNSIAISLARKNLVLARKYELYHIGIELLSILRLDALQNGKIRDYEKFSGELLSMSNLLSAEYEIKGIENRIRINFSKSLFIDQKYREEAKRSLQLISELLETKPTFLGRMSYYRLLYMHYQLEGHPEKSIESCEIALKYLESKPHMTSKARQAEFYLYMLENYLLLGNVKKGSQVAKICSGFYRVGSNNWFKYKEYHFLLMMQTTDFRGAFSIFTEIICNGSYETLNPVLQERWKVFGYYVKYALKGEHLIFAAKNRTKVKRVIPAQSKDKQGFHVALILLNIISLMEEGKKQELVKQMEALSTYRFKFLSGKQSYQSFLLIRLVVLTIENDFDLFRMRRKSIGIERKLSKSKPSSAEVLECVQIMPPLWMWERMKLALMKADKK